MDDYIKALGCSHGMRFLEMMVSKEGGNDEPDDASDGESSGYD
jgi:hypothetical protein